MKVIVLGGGVIGVTTAYYLAKGGADVTLIDRRAGVAEETSFANAGQISPGYSTPWAAPGIPQKAVKWLFQKHAPLAITPDGTAFQSVWIRQMLANCTSQRYAINKERMMRVAEYSRDCIRVLRDETSIGYEERIGGVLQLFRKQVQLNAVNKDIEVLKECGVPFELLDADGIVEVEPALKHATGLVGGLRLPNDETGDCYLFTTRLAKICEKMGVSFMMGQVIDRLLVENNKITGVVVGDVTLTADSYVLAFGSFSRQMLAPIGLSVPVYPVKGYSLTLPILDEDKAPISTVLDETYKVAITRFDARIRVGGMAELSGFNTLLNPKRRETLEMVTRSLFDGGDYTKGEFWTGLRPMTPDGTPIIGETPIEGLYLNTGHGTLGWTMACGSGKLVSDVVLGAAPDISLEGLSVARYKQ